MDSIMKTNLKIRSIKLRNFRCLSTQFETTTRIVWTVRVRIIIKRRWHYLQDNNSYAANPRSRDNETDRRPAMQRVHWDVSWWIVPLVNVNCSRLSIVRHTSSRRHDITRLTGVSSVLQTQCCNSGLCKDCVMICYTASLAVA